VHVHVQVHPWPKNHRPSLWSHQAHQSGLTVPQLPCAALRPARAKLYLTRRACAALHLQALPSQDLSAVLPQVLLQVALQVALQVLLQVLLHLQVLLQVLLQVHWQEGRARGLPASHACTVCATRRRVPQTTWRTCTACPKRRRAAPHIIQALQMQLGEFQNLRPCRHAAQAHSAATRHRPTVPPRGTGPESTRHRPSSPTVPRTRTCGSQK
jgi:hypothetical protein